ncbi:hypothetical protein OIO90_006403 [Microbotryomycetes sp. JL221]|nr:hypothetical protein OIO90_006403 [Microbotryomycetes sp. JL221]
MSQPRRFAFYCSGHGYGHATRVSALTSSLLEVGHHVAIVTNAPTTPFSAVLDPTTSSSLDVTSSTRSQEASPCSSTSKGPSTSATHYATYRKRNVDAGIVQPKAYDVDRQATFNVLNEFIDAREETLREEVTWLKSEKIDAVLSDSTFLGCAAAKGAGIPSIIVSNFTFDSCYSYLSHPAQPSIHDWSPESPLPSELLDPLVDRTIADYACADLLLRLPGAIPIPAFDTDVPMPAGKWVTQDRSSFTTEIEQILSRPTSKVPRGKVIDVPLIVRPLSINVFTNEFKYSLLKQLGVPKEMRDDKILLVSFGGQSIPRPKSQPPSPLATPLETTASSPTTTINGSLAPNSNTTQSMAGLLPPGWISIVCGLGNGNEIKKDLPNRFFSSNEDIYIPDLTAIADVVLGKLGYGTCSETISACTPFVYVPRPLFIEEFGLRRLMSKRGFCIELSRTDFEAGRWQFHVERAFELGQLKKLELKSKGWKDEKSGQVIRIEIEKFLNERERER